MSREYRNLELAIGKADSGYRAHIVLPTGDETSADFSFPFSTLELENFILQSNIL